MLQELLACLIVGFVCMAIEFVAIARDQPLPGAGALLVISIVFARALYVARRGLKK